MKVNALYKELGLLIDAGHGRKFVCINKETFNHALESDGVCIIDVNEVNLETHVMADDDGGQLFRKDGSEVLRTSVILKGHG